MFNRNVILVLLSTFALYPNSQESGVDLTYQYFSPIHDIKVGDIIRVKGIIPKHAFAVNLINGTLAYIFDIPLHYKLAGNDLSAHTYKSGNWVNPESFVKPHNTETCFEFAILVESTHYSLAMNGEYVGDYKHQLPIAKATYLNVSPNVEVTAVSFEKGATAESTYSWPLSGGIKPENIFRLKGVVPKNSDGFDINFQNGRIYKFYDMPFSIIINAKDQTTLFNTFKSGQWQHAESHIFPITRGVQFDIKIVCGSSEFKIIVDGSEIGTFQHRIPISSITWITVTKGVQVASLEFEK